MTLQFLFLIVLLYCILESLVYLKQKRKKEKKQKTKHKKISLKEIYLLNSKDKSGLLKTNSFFQSLLQFLSVPLPNGMMSIDIEVS